MRLQKVFALALALAVFLNSSCLTACAVEETAKETTEITETTPQTEATEPETEPKDATRPEKTEPEETKPAEDPAQSAEDIPVMPAYFQEDYPDVPFGTGTVADSGGSVTALAMAASFLTGFDYTPDVLAGYFGKYAGDDSALLEHGAEVLGLPCHRAADFQEILEALENGCVAICKMDSQSVFTGDTQLIVLRGVNSDGKIFVNDPLRENQEKSMLQDGYENGFPKGWISTGWETGWIFDPEEVSDPAFYAGEKPLAREMPLYNQMDYKDVRYGAGTVATSGCGITSLAMVATYMTGHTYYPDELAGYFGGYNGNNIERLLNASEELQLPYQQSPNWHVTLKALQEGKIAILLMNGRSLFSDSQHFIVATGVTEDGKVKINDPYGPNYSVPMLKDGFANGFTSEQIATGYSSAWIYDVDQMPEEPFVYVEETVEVEFRYGDLTLSDNDMELLARLVWVEARGEVDEGQQAVAEVILNRVVSEQFPDNVRGVIYADNQFLGAQYIDEAEPTQTQYEAVERALYGPYILPMEVTHFATYRVNKDVWGTIGRHTFCYQWSPD